MFIHVLAVAVLVLVVVVKVIAKTTVLVAKEINIKENIYV